MRAMFILLILLFYLSGFYAFCISIVFIVSCFEAAETAAKKWVRNIINK